MHRPPNALSSAAAARRRSDGMTMVEMAVVLAITALLAAFIGPPLIEAVTAYDKITRGLNAKARLRYALERMVSEIRQMDMQTVLLERHNTSAAFSTQIFSFTKHDGVLVGFSGSGIPATNSRITMTYGSGIITGSQTLIDGVTAFTVNRYQNTISGTTAATNQTNIAAVRITMTITEDGIAYTGTARADLRSRW